MHGPSLLGGDFVFLVPLQPQLSDEISYDFVPMHHSIAQKTPRSAMGHFKFQEETLKYLCHTIQITTIKLSELTIQ